MMHWKSPARLVASLGHHVTPDRHNSNKNHRGWKEISQPPDHLGGGSILRSQQKSSRFALISLTFPFWKMTRCG
jgi:hypothetical protein